MERFNFPNKPRTKVFLFSIYSLLIIGFCFGVPHLTLAQDKILAIVNNEIITQKDHDDFLNFIKMQLSTRYNDDEGLKIRIDAMSSDLLQRLIEDRLILQAAKRENIVIDQNMIRSRIGNIRKRYPSEEDFQQVLKMQGLTQNDLENKIRDQMLIFAMIETKIKTKIIINPKDVTDYYVKHVPDFTVPEQRQVQSFVIEKLDIAEKVFAALNNRVENFQKVAQAHSLSVNNLGMVKRGQLKKELEEVVFKLDLNKCSRVIEFDNRYYIFTVAEIVSKRQLNLDEVSNIISSLLFEERLEKELTKWLDELKKESYITIKED